MKLIGRTFTVSAERKAPDTHPVYTKVFNGKVWAVERKDFPDGEAISVAQMRSRLISAARHRGLRVESRVRDDGETLELRAVKRAPVTAPARRTGTHG